MLPEYLHDYQHEPVTRFMERGSLLCALDTGGGKTVITIAACEELLALGRAKRVLIVVPASLKYQWANKLAAFTDLPKMTKKLTVDGRRVDLEVAASPGCVVIDGTPEQRKKQYRLACERECEYVICGYDNPMDDWRQVRRLAPDVVVVDEASALKSAASKRSQFYKDNLSAPYRLALTATPAENGRPEEIYSIMEWVDPSIFGTRPDLFDKAYVDRDDFGRPKGWKNLDVFLSKLAPAMFRMTREDPVLAEHLPTVRELTWTVTLDDDTWMVYERIATELAEELGQLQGASSTFDVLAYYEGKPSEKGAGGRASGRRIAVEMLLCHPKLVISSGREYKRTKGESGSEYAASIVDDPDLNYITWSPKLNELWKQLDILAGDGDPKVMIYTRYPRMLDLIGDYLRDGSYVKYHGGMTAKQKAAAAARFSTDSECKYFLSSHAGAKGNDMPMAEWLINYDLPWDHGTAYQINGRHVRASSEFDTVYVVNMLCEGTVEERKQQTVKQKGAVAGAMLDGKGAKHGRIDNEVDSLRKYLVDSLDLAG